MPRVAMGTASFPFDAPQLPAAVRDAVLRAIEAGCGGGVRHRGAALGGRLGAVRSGMVASRDELYITSKLSPAHAHPGHVVPALRATLR
uniref:Uncharacterized protein n=1 Tax=Oryza brachyantha TaxID=4533 RepID=J3N0L3_ORYBR